LKKVTEPSAPDLTFSLENPVYSVVKHKVQGAQAPEVLYHKSSTPKSHKNTESFSESWYPKLDDLGAESVEFKPQKLSFSAEKISLPVTTSPVITSTPPSLGYSHLLSPYKSLTESVPTLAQSLTLTTAVSQLASPLTYSAAVVVTSVHLISETVSLSVAVTASPVVTSAIVVTAPSVVSVSTGLPLIYPVTTVSPVILITVVTPALTTAVTSVTTVLPTVAVSTTPVVTTVSTSVITTAPTVVVPSVITTGPPTLPPAVGVGVGIPVSAAPPLPTVLIDTSFRRSLKTLFFSQYYCVECIRGVFTD